MSSLYDLTALSAAALHAVGKSAGTDTGNSATIIVNVALDALVNAHAWSWRSKSADLAYVSGQSWIALPADFSELVYLRAGASLSTVVIPTSLDRILQLRQFPNSNPSLNAVIYYCVVPVDQSAGTAASTYRIEIFPTPSANLAAALAVTYQKQVPALSSGTSVANIPLQMQSCLLMLARGYAEMMENNQPGINMQLAVAELEKRKVRDGMTQPVIGRIHGEVEDQWRGDDDRDARFATDTATTV